MANRRQFIQAGAAIAATALPAVSAITSVGAALPLYKVVYDRRFAAARSFGAAAQERSASVHAIDGDVHELWYHDLYHRWQSAPAAIAGMTAYNPMFLLGMFAQDVGMRLIYRANHRGGQGGMVAHELYGPPAQRARQGELQDSERNWGAAAAQIVLSWLSDAVSIAKAHSNIAQANRKSVGADTLMSWIIAPVRRV